MIVVPFATFDVNRRSSPVSPFVPLLTPTETFSEAPSLTIALFRPATVELFAERVTVPLPLVRLLTLLAPVPPMMKSIVLPLAVMEMLPVRGLEVLPNELCTAPTESASEMVAFE